MKKLIRFMKSQEAFAGTITLINGTAVPVLIESTGIGHYTTTGIMIYSAVIVSLVITSFVIGYLVWKKKIHEEQ